jgi:hypothetical protein
MPKVLDNVKQVPVFYRGRCNNNNEKTSFTEDWVADFFRSPGRNRRINWAGRGQSRSKGVDDE